MLSFLSSCIRIPNLDMKTTSIILRKNVFILLFILLSWTQISIRACKIADDPDNSLKGMRFRYDQWMSRYDRRYKDKRELDYRFGIYETNVVLIDSFNSQNTTFKLTDNIFADQTNEEFRQNYLGFTPSWQPQTKFKYSNETELPTHIDWRDENAVTVVKDQGSCGSCWAFSAVAAVESLNKIKTGDLISFSEQELVDCDIVDHGCGGGTMENAYEFIIRKKGIAKEEDYPYTGSDSTCDKSRTKHLVRNVISGYETVPSDDEKSLKAAVARQPVAVAIDAASFEFQLYSEGIFSGHCGSNINHGVTAVGYGEENENKYWLVKNSWGGLWGESGYVKIERDSSDSRGACGIAMQASYPTKK